MKQLSAANTSTEALKTLGLYPRIIDITHPDAIACALRRSAGYLCPCSSSALVASVLLSLRGLTEDDNELREMIEDMLNALIAHGDLLEIRDITCEATRGSGALIYVAPPSFVRRESGALLLIGIFPDSISSLPEDIESRIQYDGCNRYLPKRPIDIVNVGSTVTVRYPDSKCKQFTIVPPDKHNMQKGLISHQLPLGNALLDKRQGDIFSFSAESQTLRLKVIQVEQEEEDLASHLAQLGLIEIQPDDWLSAPPDTSPDEHIAQFDRKLDGVTPSGEIPDLLVIDPNRPAHYYRGRWVEPRGMTGRFVGRRPQSYGSPLWCYIELQEGWPIRFVDLPLNPASRLRGCDEGWRLQTAIDAQRGESQIYQCIACSNDAYMLKVFSPVPMWIERRWNSIGHRILPKPAGCLLAYQFDKHEIEEELRFVQDKLWLREREGTDR